MFNVLQWLKKIRYPRLSLFVLIVIIYVLWKAYVLYTPSPHDDEIPDKIKDGMMMIVCDYADDDTQEDKS